MISEIAPGWWVQTLPRVRHKQDMACYWKVNFILAQCGGKSRPEHQVTGFTTLFPSDHLIFSSPSVPRGYCKTLHALPLYLVVQIQ